MRAVNELRDRVNQLDSDRMQQKTTCMVNKVTWHFNLLAAPHFEGVYEATIKSAKHVIHALRGGGMLCRHSIVLT